MSSSTNLQLLLLLFILPVILSLPIPPSLESGNTYVEQKCKEYTFTDTDYALCVSSIKSDPRGSTLSNTIDMTLILRNVTLDRLSDTVAYVSKLNTDTADTNDKKILANVLQNYEKMRKDLESVSRVSIPEDRKDVYTAAGSAHVDARECMDQNRGLRGGPPPEMVTRGGELVHLSSVIVNAVFSLIQG
ncbi:hypothetical protein QJS04_geneDACA007043 [Acorus gramineus]|uniref:Pectinesterase inhibitor domain-containing protein n=1 Tax=Acorus gramineus TaxID=55184 RepID=A0AAV9BJS8_ACOGR|nr:hypothetical protein QJS04_geneDACA007043 [Acorus gramineus]